MYKILIRLFIITTIIVLSSCNIRDDNDNCGVYLEFVFDHNMEYANSFNPQVGTVDIYVFDKDGKYLFTEHKKRTDLIDNSRLFFGENLVLGTYQILTVGDFCDKYSFNCLDENELTPRVTTIDQVKLSLARDNDQISHEFPHLWFGTKVSVNYKADRSVWPVNLIRNTNKFNIVLQDMNADPNQVQDEITYTFEITTPEGANYDYNNQPLTREMVTYHPYHVAPGDLISYKINTMRLLAEDPDGYKIILRNKETSKELWSYDLIDLLDNTRPHAGDDGSQIPLQEYLDRQGEWNIVVVYKKDVYNGDEGFVAVKIEVNDWILWLNDIEV